MTKRRTNAALWRGRYRLRLHQTSLARARVAPPGAALEGRLDKTSVNRRVMARALSVKITSKVACAAGCPGCQCGFGGVGLTKRRTNAALWRGRYRLRLHQTSLARIAPSWQRAWQRAWQRGDRKGQRARENSRAILILSNNEKYGKMQSWK